MVWKQSTVFLELLIIDTYVTIQQTPKPEAQFPDASPPSSVHCSDVTHSPNMGSPPAPWPMAPIAVTHAVFGNVTTENRENAPKIDERMVKTPIVKKLKNG